MSNPWEEIDIEDYEKHMSLDSVHQLQAMNKMMKEQFYAHPVKAIMILGIAGGNGLEHIDVQRVEKVYGIDINAKYLDTCKRRYPELRGTFEALCVDLTQEVGELPKVDLVIANLLIEYIGYARFQMVIKQIKPRYVSCGIQINMDASFVSQSPYIKVFDDLEEVLHTIEATRLIEVMDKIGYRLEAQLETELPNGKKLVRLDFQMITTPIKSGTSNIRYK